MTTDQGNDGGATGGGMSEEELDRLEADQAAVVFPDHLIVRLLTEIRRLRAENARLVGANRLMDTALDEFAHWGSSIPRGMTEEQYAWDSVRRMRHEAADTLRRAREALAAKGGGEG